MTTPSHHTNDTRPGTLAGPLSRRELMHLSGLAGLGLLAPGLLAACAGSAGTSYEATIADARVAIAKALADSGTASISVALLDRERLIWTEAFGFIDKAAKTAPTPETLFCIGSCSKVIAAMTVMILVDRGQVELDAPLLRYLPQFRMAAPEYTQVTVRTLIDHASGFPGSDNRNQGAGRPYPGYAAQVMQTLSTSRLKHLPGEMSVYCNDGFTMVEPLIEALTGKAYAQFVADEILSPLGMSRSRFALAPFPPGSYAPGYAGDTKLAQEFMNAYASGGLNSTPSDMARLAMMLLNDGQWQGRRILSASAVREMAGKQTATEPLQPVVMADGFGLGWDGVREGGLASVGVTAWHKNGGTNIYGSELFVLPDEGLALFITGTSTHYGPIALAERIVLNALQERGRIASVPAPLPATPLPTATPSAAQLAEMSGLYANYTTIARLEPVGAALALSTYLDGAWSAATRLQLRNDGSFSSDDDPLTAYSSALAQGERYLVKRSAGAVVGQGLKHHLEAYPFMQQLKPRSGLMPAWLARLSGAGLLGLPVNYPADSPGMQAPLVPLLAVAPAELPGYVLNYSGQVLDASTSNDVARMCLKIPYIFGRDLSDFEIINHGGEDFVRIGSEVFRPLPGVPVLAVGTASTVTIDAQAYAEWRKLPAGATVSIQGASDWKLYGADFQPLSAGSGSVTGLLAPAGAFLLLYAAANNTISLSLS